MLCPIALRTVLSLVALLLVARVPLPAQSPEHHARRIAWADVAPLQARLETQGLSAQSFPGRIERIAADNARRIRLGDLDHLVFYLLQSTSYTRLPSIEPALSARAFVDGLSAEARLAFLRGDAPRRPLDDAVRARLRAFVAATGRPGSDARLTYFARLLSDDVPDAAAREARLTSEYLRVMRFVYEKEFGAGRATPAGVADLYQTRGLSTDTAVEAGFVVAQAAGMLRGLDPARRIRRVLLIGAGLDLAPRTALLESAPPQSYQPWAVLDALVGLGLSTLGDVEIVAADINPRVVEHLRNARTSPPELLLVSGLADEGPVTLAPGYREYFDGLGRSIGEVGAGKGSGRQALAVPAGHLFKRVRVSREAALAVDAVRLDIVTERLTDRPFDLVVATNVLPYFDDDALALAMTNIAAMLGDGGVLLHNEGRPALHAMAPLLGLPPSHSRHAVIANVRGAAPLGDSVWLHEKKAAASQPRR
ncbi:MAG TPA: hypothetical protein VMF13_22985 [Luteitalea sp.]|nr:hypothetical protein [Luteitalea sp.]